MHNEERFIEETTTKLIDELSVDAYQEIAHHGSCWDGNNPNFWRYIFPRLVDDWLENHNCNDGLPGETLGKIVSRHYYVPVDMQQAAKWFTPDKLKNFEKDEQELIVNSFELACAKSLEFEDPYDIPTNLRVLLILDIPAKRIIELIQSASMKGKYQLAEAVWNSDDPITTFGDNPIVEDLPINQRELETVYEYLFSPEFSETLK